MCVCENVFAAPIRFVESLICSFSNSTIYQFSAKDESVRVGCLLFHFLGMAGPFGVGTGSARRLLGRRLDRLQTHQQSVGHHL